MIENDFSHPRDGIEVGIVGQHAGSGSCGGSRDPYVIGRYGCSRFSQIDDNLSIDFCGLIVDVQNVDHSVGQELPQLVFIPSALAAQKKAYPKLPERCRRNSNPIGRLDQLRRQNVSPLEMTIS